MKRENCNIFILFKQRCNVLQTLNRDFLNEYKITYKDFAKVCIKV